LPSGRKSRSISQRRRADRGHPCRRSGFRKITSGANNNGFASYAPDGERIVYRTTGPEGDGLRIMNLKDRTVMSLTAEYDNFPVGRRGEPDRIRASVGWR